MSLLSDWEYGPSASGRAGKYVVNMIFSVYLMGIIISMMTTSIPIKGLVTANVTSHEPMVGFIETLSATHLLAIQEHHVDIVRLGEFQDRVADLGWRGLWAPAVGTDRGNRRGSGSASAHRRHHHCPTMQ